jgi:putative Mg2+ transporter-C (MgtC) family protein
MNFLAEAFTLDWQQAAVDLLRVILAFALAMPVAWERFRSDRNLGLRTFPIVAMASCGFVLIAKPSAENNPETLARILQGLLSGIGFIGGGVILKRGTNVKGLATAASIWCTGAIGAAVAYEREEIAAVLSIITYLTLRCLTPIVKEENTGESESRGG